MEARHAWEKIYQRDGRVFNEPFPRFEDLVVTLIQHGCKRILDLGCGNGRHVLALARRGFEVVGQDAALTGLKLAQAWLSDERVAGTLVMGDMMIPLPFQSGSFDALIATQVIHHAYLEDIRRTISEVHRILKRCGIAFITVPAKPDPDEAYQEIAPSTLSPLTGSEAGVPHLYFTLEAFRTEFGRFEVLELSIRGDHVVIALTAQKL